MLYSRFMSPETSEPPIPARSLFRSVVKWWLASTIVGFLVYWLLGIVIGVVQAPRDAAGIIVVGLVVGPFYAAVPVLACSLVYLIVFALWPFFARRLVWIDRPPGLFLVCILLATPTSLVAGHSQTTMFGGESVYALLVTVSIVIGMVVPRSLVSSIGYAAFAARPEELPDLA
jgi:hypothetical protein